VIIIQMMSQTDCEVKGSHLDSAAEKFQKLKFFNSFDKFWLEMRVKILESDHNLLGYIFCLEHRLFSIYSFLHL